MATEISKKGLTLFEKIREVDENGNEFWSARDLSKVLDYEEYRNFKTHFEVGKKVRQTIKEIGK